MEDVIVYGVLTDGTLKWIVLNKSFVENGSLLHLETIFEVLC
jgi:hypothetical protein